MPSAKTAPGRCNDYLLNDKDDRSETRTLESGVGVWEGADHDMIPHPLPRKSS